MAALVDCNETIAAKSFTRRAVFGTEICPPPGWTGGQGLSDTLPLAHEQRDRTKRSEKTENTRTHLAVNQVLEEALVIPINSPPYRAAYNGGIEHTQGEFKSYLDR